MCMKAMHVTHAIRKAAERAINENDYSFSNRFFCFTVFAE